MTDEIIDTPAKEVKKEFDVKIAISCLSILILALSIYFGAVMYKSYQLEKEVNSLSEEIRGLEDNVISKKVVATMCIDKNCTLSALVINTTNIY